MRLFHCPKDGNLLVWDAKHWYCLLCGFTLPEDVTEPVVRRWSWPPEANPLHEKHTHPKIEEENPSTRSD